jgi:molybdate transport system ATP-binding protein
VYASQSLGRLPAPTDRLVVLAGGRVLSDGTLAQLARDGQAMQVLGLQPVSNVLPATVLGHDPDDGCTLARTFGIELALPLRRDLSPGAEVPVAVRSSDIALSRQYLTGTSIQNQIKGRVCALVRNGDSVLVQVDCGTTLLAGVTPRAARDLDLAEGDEVYCLAKTQSFVYLDEPELGPLAQPVRWLPPPEDTGDVLDVAAFRERTTH